MSIKNLCLDVFFLPFRFQWIESKRSRIFLLFLRGRSEGMRFFDVRRLGEACQGHAESLQREMKIFAVSASVLRGQKESWGRGEYAVKLAPC